MSVNILFNDVLSLIEKVVLLMLMLVPAIRECEKSRFYDRLGACSYSHYQIEMGETVP